MTSGILLGSVTLAQNAIRATYTCESFSLMSFKCEYTNMHSKSYGWVTIQTCWPRSKDFSFSTTAFLLCMLLVGISQTWWNTQFRGTRTTGRWKTTTDCAVLYCSAWLQRENYFGFLYCLLKCVSNGLERKDQPTGGQFVTSTGTVTWWQTPEHSCREKHCCFWACSPGWKDLQILTREE